MFVFSIFNEFIFRIFAIDNISKSLMLQHF
jgi:hypothetical protein